MNKKCKLTVDGNGGYTSDSVDELYYYLSDAVSDKLANILEETVKAYKLALKLVLILVGKDYNLTYINLITKTFLDLLTEVFDGSLDRFLPDAGIKNTILLNKETAAEELTQDSYSQELNEDESIHTNASLFLDDLFGNKTKLKNKLVLDVTHNLLNTFVLDREKGTIVQNAVEANINVRQYKEMLFKLIMDYIKSLPFAHTYGLPEDLKLFDGDEYLSTLSLESVQKSLLLITDVTEDLESLSPEKLLAVEAIFVLRNFDNFVNLVLGKAVLVNPEAKNKLKSGDNYSFATKSSNLITTWRTDDNIVLENEISALAQSIINSTPFLKNKCFNKTDSYIKFEDYYRLITKIKDLVLDKLASSMIISRTSKQFSELFEDPTLTDKDLKMIENKSVRELINKIRINPQIYLPLVMKILNYKDTMGILGFNAEEKDKCWSLYLGFFNPNYSESIINIQNKYDYTSRNYYEFITQVADSLFTVNFLQYNEENNTINIRSLKDLGSENTRRNIENIIYRNNSYRILMEDFAKLQMQPYLAEIIYSDDETPKDIGIKYTISYSTDALNIQYNAITGTLKILNSEGKDINPNSANQYLHSQEFLKFIDKQLFLDLEHDSEYLDKLVLTMGGTNDSYNKTLYQLTTLASMVYFNKYLTNVKFKNLNAYNEASENLNSIYGDSELKPSYNYQLNEISLVPKSRLALLSSLAIAKNLVTGEAQSSMVKDAEGNMLSSLTLSRLLGSLTSQWEEILSMLNESNITNFLNPLGLISEQNIVFGKYTLTFLDEQLSDPDESPIFMDLLENHIYLNKNWLIDTYNNKLYTLDKIYDDGTIVKGLSERAFNNINEFITYIILKEIALNTELKTDNETQTEFENRISAFVYSSLNFGTAASQFSIMIPGMYRGCYTAKEYKNGMSNKPHTEFTVAESIESNFIYDFVGGLMDVNDITGKNIVGNGKVGLLPSVNSDKNTIGRAIFDLNTICEEFNKPYKALTNEELEIVLSHELYRAYNVSYLNILEDYARLESWINSTLNVKLTFNPENNFKEFNDYCKANNFIPLVHLMDLVNDYNQAHPKNNLKLTDLVHYQYDKKSQLLKFNNTFKDLLNRYQDPKNLHTFMDYKKSELLKSLLDENFSVSLIDDSEELTPKKELLNKFPTWVNTSYYNGALLVIINNGKMVIAKLFYHGHEYNITSKSDLNYFLEQTGFDLLKHPHDVMNPSIGITLKLHPMLEKYNTLDYFLTLEFMMAGVGSHIAHPFKKTLDVPLLWCANIDTDNKDYMNIDDELALDLAKQPDGFNLDDFYIKEFDKFKTLAKTSNKILVTSSENLLRLFSNLFTKIINDLSLNDFINSGRAYYLQQLIIDNSMLEEATRFLAQHKRNVSYTAAMHEFQLNQLTGIPGIYNMAIMDDIQAPVYTNSGDSDSATPFDGATFVNPWVVIWENNSLKGDKAGIDKKQFVHYYDERTGTGGIIKTAGFGVTNDRVRNYKFYQTMIKNMTDHKWLNDDGSEHIMLGGGILSDFEGNAVNYGPIYYKLGSRYFMREILNYAGNNVYNCLDTEVDNTGSAIDETHPVVITVNSNYNIWQMFGGRNSLDFNNKGLLEFSEKSIELTAKACNSYGFKVFDLMDVNIPPVYYNDGQLIHKRTLLKSLGNNTYEYSDEIVDTKGKVLLSNFQNEKITISSEEDIINFLGGNSSMDFDNTYTLVTSPIDNNLLTELTTLRTAALSNKAHDATDIWQPMKYSDIHYMPTIGAVKLGAGNINQKESFYKDTKLNYMRVKMRLAGILLDKEHHADNANLSLMTLVISAACAKGYKPEAAKKLYQSLYNLTKVGTAEFRNSMGQITSDPEAFDTAVSNIILKSIVDSSSSDGDMIQIIARNLIHEMRHNKNLKLDATFAKLIDNEIPYSDASIFGKIVSNLTVAMTKSGIKTKMAGVLSVLCPAHSIIKFYKIPITAADGSTLYKRVRYSELESILSENLDYNSQEELDTIISTRLDEILHMEAPVDLADIEMGYKYLITYDNGTKEIVQVTMPNSIKSESLGKTVYDKDSVEIKTIGYKDLKKQLGHITQILEWVKDGLDLKSYNVKFLDVGNHKYLLADLDIVQDYFQVKEIGNNTVEKAVKLLSVLFQLMNKYGNYEEFLNRITQVFSTSSFARTGDYANYINDMLLLLRTDSIAFLKALLEDTPYDKQHTSFRNYVINFGLRALNRELQKTLNSLSKDSTDSTVFINNEKVQVNKLSTQVSAYGVIMPKTFKSNLGLDTFDDVPDILADPEFFTKKIISKLTTKVECYDEIDGTVVNNFDLELKRADGNHIYIHEGLDNTNFELEVTWFKRTDALGNVYRIDADNKVMYQMFSELDRIFKDIDGNEIIVPAEDKILYKDADGNIKDIHNKSLVLLNSRGKYIDAKTHKPLIIEHESGILFYLDHMGYNTVNISAFSSLTEFDKLTTLLEKSTNKKANKVALLLLTKPRGDERIEYMLKLNNYDKILDSDPDKQSVLSYYHELGLELYTSFKESLHIIAARIPAQNLQSFMPMEVEAYDAPDINTAYVSIFQFYLLGSDLDIDAVSLQTVELDRNGLYIGHSPYFSLKSSEMSELSKQLPFPTGIPIQPKTTKTRSKCTVLKFKNLIGLANKLNDALIKINPTKNGPTFSVNISSEENLNLLMLLLAESNIIINDPSDSEKVLNTLNKLLAIKEGDVYLRPLDLPELYKFFAKVIDDHNLYLNRLSLKRKELAIKNYVTTQLYDIISDPINLMQAQSSVDAVTGPAKELAKDSPKATVQNTFTPGNVADKFLSIVENMVGKDGIAICATGLKSYFALTELYSLIMSDSSKTEKDKLLFNVSIGGKEYRGLANGFTHKFINKFERDIDELSLPEQEKLFSDSVQDYLFDLLWASDAANDMSALLGLSVDNAKELILAKMNAGTASIGMYLYGLSIGMSFDDLYNIMTSPLAFKLTELTKGDCFSGDDGSHNIVGALNYLFREPKFALAKYNKFDVSKYENLESPVDFIYFNLISELKLNELETRKHGVLQTALKQTLNKPENIKILKDILNNKIRKTINDYAQLVIVENDVNKVNQTKYIQLCNQCVDFMLNYIDDVTLAKSSTYSNVFGTHSLRDDLEALALGAEEMKNIGKILRLNLEIKTNPNELIIQVDNIEKCILNRAKAIKAYNDRNNISEDTYGLLHPKLKNLIYGKSIGEDVEVGGDMINLEKFIEDETYANKCIALYDSLKASYNPLRILKLVPHYRGYSESMYIAYKGLKKKSNKFNIISLLSRKIITDLNISNPLLQQLVVKNIENSYDKYIRQYWMRKSAITIPSEKKPRSLNFTIPASTKTKVQYAFTDTLKQAVPLTYPKLILLGTDTGDANFKLWMEKTVIPELKAKYPNNLFLKDLQTVVNTKTLSGVVAVNYGLNINMMPKSDYEIDNFNEHKDAFNELQTYDHYKDGANISWSIPTLFYLYSLICNNGKHGPTSLQAIFLDYIVNEYSIAPQFEHFISKADLNPDLIARYNAQNKKMSIIDIEDVIPMGSPYTGGSDRLKQKDKNNGIVYTWVKTNLVDVSNRDPRELPMEVNGYYKMSSIIPEGTNLNYFFNHITTEDFGNTTFNWDEETLKKYPTLGHYKFNLNWNPKTNTLGFVNVDIQDPSLLYLADTLKTSIIEQCDGIFAGTSKKALLKLKTVIDPETNIITENNIDLKTLNDICETIEKCISK